jgi:hypothetical protein
MATGRHFTPDPEDADFDTVLQEALEVVRELGLAGPDADPDQAREVIDKATDWALRETVVRSRPPRDTVSATPQPDTRQRLAALRPGPGRLHPSRPDRQRRHRRGREGHMGQAARR